MSVSNATIAQHLLPYASRDFSVAGGTMRYLDEGNPDAEETILCVHGNPTWSFYYRKVIERFAQDRQGKPGRRVIAVDHLGCGRSDKPSRDQFLYTMAAHRDNLVSLIDHLDLRNVTLLAHDWGGAIGLSSLVERRDRFSRIMLLNTAAFPPPYVPIRISACRWPIVGTPMVRGLNAFAKAAVTMTMSRNKMTADVAEGLLAPYYNWETRVAIDAFVRDIPTSDSHPTMATLRKLESDLPGLATLPSLLVWGMKDWCFRPECLRRLQAAWPDATSVEIEDAGHYVIEDAPQETLDAIDQFLQTH